MSKSEVLARQAVSDRVSVMGGGVIRIALREAGSGWTGSVLWLQKDGIEAAHTVDIKGSRCAVGSGEYAENARPEHNRVERTCARSKQ